MNVRRSVLVAVTVVLFLAVTASSASAAVFRGETSGGGFQATIRTDGEGVPTRFWLKKYKVDCGDGFFFRDRGSGSIPPFDVANDRRLFDRGPRYDIRDGNLRISVLTTVRARFKGGAWRGTFRSQVTVLRQGEQVDTCNGKFRYTLRERG